MPRFGTVLMLLLLGSLSGCTAGAPANTVAAATPTIQSHSFRIYGTPADGEFMVDDATGTVWQLSSSKPGDPKKFVPIEVEWPATAGPPPGATIVKWSDLK